MQVLSLNKINKQIKDKIILKDISFTLEEGEILGLLGPNGAGKTSMMKIISGLSRANSGRLDILGIDVDKERAKIKSQLGFVMQDNNMEREFSVKEALLYYARLYKVKNYKYEVEKIISQFEMNTWQDRKIEKLSGGMARKAMIARALLVKPKILLLDEPSVGLDPDVRYDIWQEIKKLKNMGISVIITTHYMEEAEYLCDKIAILKQGELLAIDEVEKIKQIMQKDENEDITLEKLFYDLSVRRLIDFEFLAVYMREMALLQKKMGKLGYIFSAVMFPIIYLFAFGMGIGPVMNNIHGGYLPFLAKGMLSITVMMNAFQQTALSVSVGRFYFKTFQTLLLSPISAFQVILGITLAGVTRGFIAGGIIYIIAMVFFDVPMLNLWGFLGILLSAFCFGILGIAIGLWIKNPDALSSVINFIITPMTFFCGTFFPLYNLPDWLQIVVGILPLTLANNLLRTEVFSMYSLLDMIYLIIITLILLVISRYQLKNYNE